MIRKKYLQDNRALISRVIPASFRHPIKRKSVRSESAIDDAGPLIILKIPVGTFQSLRWNTRINDRVNIAAHIPRFEEINAPLPLLFLPMHEI